MKKKSHIFIRFLSIFTAAYILNYSVNTPDAILYGYVNTEAIGASKNEVESVVEYILEVQAGDTDAIPESNETEQEAKFSAKKIDFFPQDKISAFSNNIITIRPKAPAYKNITYSDLVKPVSGQPPEA